MAGQRRGETSAARAAARRRNGAKGGRPGADAPLKCPVSAPIQDPEVERRMAEFMALCGKPDKWTDAKTMEQTRAEITRTLTAVAVLAKERGDMVPRGTVQQATEALRDCFQRGFDGHPKRVADRLTEYPPAFRAAVAEAVAADQADTFAAIINEARNG